MKLMSGVMAMKSLQSHAKLIDVPICDNAPALSKPIKPVAQATGLC
jgi:hypothetical protein